MRNNLHFFNLLFSISGLGLTLFLIHHILAASLALIDPISLNFFGYYLNQKPFIVLLELLLFTIFLIHLLTVSSKKTKINTLKLISGGMILVITVVHVLHFSQFEPFENYLDLKIRDLSKKIELSFQQIVVVALYSFSAIPLGLHLSGAIHRALKQVFGTDENTTFRKIDIGVTGFISLAYAIVPWLYFLKFKEGK